LESNTIGTYSTSKAALFSLHESLTAELGLSSPVKTTLVVAGQLYTPLFYGVETPSTFFAPVLEPLEIARQIVKNIETRKGGEIYAPWYVGYMYLPPIPPICLYSPDVSLFPLFVPILQTVASFCLFEGDADGRWIMRGLPSSLAWFVRWIGGVDTAIGKWRGPERFTKEQSIVFENGKH
jgi:hypothetical protein